MKFGPKESSQQNQKGSRRKTPLTSPRDNFVSLSRTLSQKELEREVSLTKAQQTSEPGLPIFLEPTSLGMELPKKVVQLKINVDIETEKKLQRLKELLAQKRQRPVNLDDLIQWCAEEMVEREDPVKKAERTLKRKERGTKPENKSGQNKRIQNQAPATVQASSSSRKQRAAIPALIKNMKWQSSQGQCEAVGALRNRCIEKTWLEMHHKVPVSQGGDNSIENLIVLCRSHHQEVHRGGFL